MREFYVYILASRTAVLYVGVTNDLERRVCEHKRKLVPGFTAKYNVNNLVYYETFPTAPQAIEAEKKIKGWTRAKKITLVEAQNPKWRDLAEDFESLAQRHPERREPAKRVMQGSPPQDQRVVANGDSCITRFAGSRRSE
jgi:putative endonuclease